MDGTACGIAAFWTLFPFPILESQLLNQKLGDSINSLAELHMRTHLAVYDAVKSTSFDNNKSAHQSHVSRLQLRFIASLAETRQLLAMSKFQIQIDGRRPRNLHASLLNNIESVFRSVSLVFYATRTFSTIESEAASSLWMNELRRVASRNENVELRTLSVLSICADAIGRGHPLPPFMDIPETSSLLEALKASPMDLLSAKHALEPGYAALAAIHASAEIVTDDLKALVRLTGELVGSVEFVDTQGSLA
ncbi:uncharacterized protein LTR77_000622 [Saxophila tyrrhenica]|uniref:DUF2421 domain-containing protein n=1 Tax=Saxophila tyrrhenica TaxID=1690608 RepID=A0AAV9PT14_9PEZI|nr:hypothetical protein LTR77_000622 [Saxophila tyrrhenica]